jgi:hypothetical protein
VSFEADDETTSELPLSEEDAERWAYVEALVDGLLPVVQRLMSTVKVPKLDPKNGAVGFLVAFLRIGLGIAQVSGMKPSEVVSLLRGAAELLERESKLARERFQKKQNEAENTKSEWKVDF